MCNPFSVCVAPQNQNSATHFMSSLRPRSKLCNPFSVFTGPPDSKHCNPSSPRANDNHITSCSHHFRFFFRIDFSDFFELFFRIISNYFFELSMIILEGGAIVGTVNEKGFSGGWDVSRAACIFSVESLDPTPPHPTPPHLYFV